MEQPELRVLHCIPPATDGEVPDAPPNPPVGAGLALVGLPRFFAHRRGNHDDLVVKLLEAAVELQQEELPLCPLAIRLSAEFEE